MKQRSLPLGIDIGTTRLRIVEAEQTSHGAHIRAVAVREISEGFGTRADLQYIAALIDDARAELRTRQRRCVCAVGEPDAVLRALQLPKMTGAERERAVRFEAQRIVPYPLDEAAVRLHPIDAPAGVWAVGIARTNAISRRSAAIRAAGLRLVAIDHDACALARAVPGFDAILDVGHERASLHVIGSHAPVTLQTSAGGLDVTRAIERELSVDAHTAEKRKRILGTAGAGDRARAALASDIASLVHHARRSAPIGRIALVGNAARLHGFAADLERASGARYEIPVCEALRGDAYPDDVVRSSAPDWTLAAGLALWGVN